MHYFIKVLGISLFYISFAGARPVKNPVNDLIKTTKKLELINRFLEIKNIYKRDIDALVDALEREKEILLLQDFNNNTIKIRDERRTSYSFNPDQPTQMDSKFPLDLSVVEKRK